MNKYQEALNDMYAVLNDSNRWCERKSLLQELVDKETPMKLLKSQFDGYRECGNCDSIVVSTNHTLPNYCGNCGQKIDWGDENDLETVKELVNKEK